MRHTRQNKLHTHLKNAAIAAYHPSVTPATGGNHLTTASHCAVIATWAIQHLHHDVSLEKWQHSRPCGLKSTEHVWNAQAKNQGERV